MQLTIALFDDRIVTVEVSDGADINDLKLVIESETKVPAHSQLLLHNGAPLSSGTLTSLNVQSGDLIMLERVEGDPLPIITPNNEGIRMNGQEIMNRLRALPQDGMPPELVAAINAGDASTAVRILNQYMTGNGYIGDNSGNLDPFRLEEAQLRAAIESDPFNADLQRKLEELIEKKNVFENYITAMEHHPESFGTVTMLYIDAHVNGHKVQAFIDSGAQMTIMSKRCAEQCGLLRLLDTRFSGVAKGVGESKILGRVHLAPLLVGGKHIPISISVLDGEMDFLFGLDNLRRHGCSIDLQSNLLKFPYLEVAVPFLAEHELPKNGMFSDANNADKSNDLGIRDDHQMKNSNVESENKRNHIGNVNQPSSSQGEARLGGGFGGGVPAGWEEKIRKLVDLGFDRSRCLAALRACDGNEEIAASMLFSM